MKRLFLLLILLVKSTFIKICLILKRLTNFLKTLPLLSLFISPELIIRTLYAFDLKL